MRVAEVSDTIVQRIKRSFLPMSRDTSAANRKVTIANSNSHEEGTEIKFSSVTQIKEFTCCLERQTETEVSSPVLRA